MNICCINGFVVYMYTFKTGERDREKAYALIQTTRILQLAIMFVSDICLCLCICVCAYQEPMVNVCTQMYTGCVYMQARRMTKNERKNTTTTTAAVIATTAAAAAAAFAAS